ncbi:MAG TPA: hypothetical protein VIV40_16515 [Kofleriaceae bacterium]
MRDATKALTVIAELDADPDRLAILRSRLKIIGDHPENNPLFLPEQVPHTHFMRFVIIERDFDLPALLAWESNYDGDVTEYLVGAVRAPIDQIFEFCIGYPAGGSDEARVWWLLEHTRRSAAFYTGYRGVPRTQVVNDRKVHDAIRDAIDRQGGHAAFDGLPAREIQRRLREHVQTTHPELDTSVSDDQRWRWRFAKLAAIVFLAPPVLVLAIVVGLPWWFTLRHKEKTDVAEPNDRPVHDDKDLSQFEDKVTQNQLTHLVEIKPGWFRYATLSFVLFAIDIIARAWEVEGDLGGITSIHFARWVIIPDTWTTRGRKRHRLLFFSNYDGSWESYLGEFVDRAAFGLSGVWSNTVGFPTTRYLIRAGAKDEEAFKQWTRRHQIPTQAWWSGVPDSTVQNIRNDLWLRRNLERRLDDNELDDWLKRL